MSQTKEKLKKGNKVEIHGLEGAQHLNGKKGKLKTFHTRGDHAGRWAVRVNGKDVAIKPENLKKFVEVVLPNEPRQVDGMIQALQSGKMDIDKLAPLPDNKNWAKGLSTTDQYEWFSNCYQMRCDDDYAYGGCKLYSDRMHFVNPEAIISSHIKVVSSYSRCILFFVTRK